MKNVINYDNDGNVVVNHNEYINSKLTNTLTQKEVSVEEGLVIAEELFQILDKRGDGIGLAANQVGIDAQVAVVNVREPLVLINPKYIKKENEIIYGEGCLSFPGHAIRTKRYRDIIISTEQEESNWYFSGVEENSDGKSGWDKGNMKQDQENIYHFFQNLKELLPIYRWWFIRHYYWDLRCLTNYWQNQLNNPREMYSQHEIDHLMGKTIHNREVKLEPTKVEKKVGRNDPS